MDIRHYFNILWRRIWVVIVTAVVTMAVVIFGTRLQTPIYEASTTLRLAVTASNDLSYYEYINVDRLMNTYVEIATSKPVVDELTQRLKLQTAPTITAEILTNTELIKITVQDPDPNVAAASANTLADILITESSKLYTGGSVSSVDVLAQQLTIAKDALDSARTNYQQLMLQTPAAPDQIAVAQQAMNLQQNTYASLLSQYEKASMTQTLQANMMTVVDPAVVPPTPASPRKLMNYGLGLVIGLLGGVGLVFLFENLDTALYSRDEIEQLLKMASIAQIPHESRRRLDINDHPDGHFAESFRNLSTRIQLKNNQTPNKVILVMGAEPRDGKSMIVHNLACALGDSGKNVVAVDCDMRLPRLNRLFRLPNESGLSDLLQGSTANPKKFLQQTDCKRVKLLASGTPAEHPSKLFSSPRMVEVLKDLTGQFDYVLLDTPALLSFADTEILARLSDSLVLVVRRTHTRRESIQTAGKFLADFPEKPASLVVNEEDNSSGYGYYHYSGSYFKHPTQRKPLYSLFRNNIATKFRKPVRKDNQG